MSYNDYCNGLGYTQAELAVQIRVQEAQKLAAKTYESREDCETSRYMATMNYTNGGCYVRSTTSPCTGGNIGGGGMGGGDSQGNSLYSSMAIGEPYFAPNETYAVSNTGRDLEIKLEALNKSFNSAVNGIKTGDQAFDDQYQRQSRELPKPNNNDRTNEELYVFYPRTSRVYLGKDNDFTDGTSNVIVPIDPERIKNQERDERIEKSLKETQHRIDSIAERNQRKIDSINNSRNKTNNTTVLANSNQEDKPALVPFIKDTYQIGTGFIRKADEGVKYYDEVLGITIPGGEKVRNLNAELNNLENGFKDLGKIVAYSFIGDVPALTSKLREIINAEVIDPLKDKAFNTANSLINKYSSTKDMLKDVGNPLKKSVARLTDTTLKGALKAEKTGDYGGYYKEVTQERLRFGNNVAKMLKKQVNK